MSSGRKKEGTGLGVVTNACPRARSTACGVVAWALRAELASHSWRRCHGGLCLLCVVSPCLGGSGQRW